MRNDSVMVASWLRNGSVMVFDKMLGF